MQFGMCHFAYLPEVESSRTQFEVLGFGLKDQVLGFGLEVSSPRKCSVSARGYLWKMGHGHDQLCFALKNARKLKACEKIFEDIFFPGKHLNFPENLRNFRAKIFFFFEERLNFPENLRIFRAKTVFLRSLPRCVLGPWPSAFLSLASRGSVLGKTVLDLGLKPCVLDSTSDIYVVKDAISHLSFCIFSFICNLACVILRI